MRTFFQRLLGRIFPNTRRNRSFDAADGGRRWDGTRTADGLSTAILAGATTAARRAGWYARNNPWIAAAVDSLVGNVIGADIKPQSREIKNELSRTVHICCSGIICIVFFTVR